MKKLIRTHRDIPAVEILASDGDLVKGAEGLARPYTVAIIRDVVARIKKDLGRKYEQLETAELKKMIIAQFEAARRKKIGRVINGAGILVHTNLGRAPLEEELFNRIRSQITGYGNLEYDVESGRRGRRGELAEDYLGLVSGAGAGTIVNNNAAALFLILNTFANRRKVVISRGELVQIGGGFRIPDIIRRSGAKLVEIGTTNITALKDYEEALKENPALILKVHRSNFDVTGFTDEPDLKALVRLGKRHDIPVVNDLGSGVLVDTSPISGRKEPTVQASVRDGAFLTCFSGDKLLGGMQSGLIVGQRDYVQKVKKNPIYRTVRVDKTIFSAVEELLGYYLNNSWQKNIKLWRLASRPETGLKKLGRHILEKVSAGKEITLEKSTAEMGGGSLPGVSLPSMALVIHSRHSASRLAEIFRMASTPVVGRIYNNQFLIDLKAVDTDDAETLIKVLKSLIKKI
jgi:L-seryl-tRNA(Ser) seleniumtransferase